MSAVLLALETSCDETAVAVLEGFGNVLAHEVLSQAPIHAEFGGVVPEVASRNHLEALPHMVNRALGRCGCALRDLSAVAATTGPGLAAALIVGASAGKGLALGAGLPFLAINHLEGHLLSPFFGQPEIPPHTALIVSGGHTLLFDVEGFSRYRLLGRTRDDAAGEAFDKIAKLLGLGYPGGEAIDILAKDGDPARYHFPRGMADSGDFQFSFSGLKTSVRRFLERGELFDIRDVCASVQAAIVDVLVEKSFRAMHENHRTILSISGGVSANSALKNKAESCAFKESVILRTAPQGLHTDNALMIAYAAAHHFAAGARHGMESDIVPNFCEKDFGSQPDRVGVLQS